MQGREVSATALLAVGTDAHKDIWDPACIIGRQAMLLVNVQHAATV